MLITQEYVDPAGPGLGAVYAKALYREYTNAGFQARKPANATQGILGPTLHAHVGDTLTVVFTARPSLEAWSCPSVHCPLASWRSRLFTDKAGCMAPPSPHGAGCVPL